VCIKFNTAWITLIGFGSESDADHRAEKRIVCSYSAGSPRLRVRTEQAKSTIFFTEFIEATRITGGLSKHRPKPYNAYYPNN